MRVVLRKVVAKTDVVILVAVHYGYSAAGYADFCFIAQKQNKSISFPCITPTAGLQHLVTTAGWGPFLKSVISYNGVQIISLTYILGTTNFNIVYSVVVRNTF